MTPQKARLEPLLRLQSQSKTLARRSPPRLTYQQQQQVRYASSLQSSSYRSNRDGISRCSSALSSTRRAPFDSRVCNPPFHRSSYLQAAAFSSSSIRSQEQASQQELTSRQYHRLSDEVFESLYGQLEETVENGSQSSWEVEYSQGVLTLSLPPTGTYVINKQPPNKQIWLSSPLSGPKRFDFVPQSTQEGQEKGSWICLKEGQEWDLKELLDRELTGIMGEEVRILE